MVSLSIITSTENNDKQTEQVLTLQRKYCPLILRNDSILHEDASTGIGGDMGVTTITVPVPQLLVLEHNITCEHSNTHKNQRPIILLISSIGQVI